MGQLLVVEDEPLLRELLTLVLTEEGYKVQAAENGTVALQLLEAWRPRVILLDLMMPPLDGWAFRAVQLAHPELRDIPVIVISAAYDVKRQAALLGASACLPKPYDLETVLRAVDQLLH
jgi:CheY-like chemotaxis protein